MATKAERFRYEAQRSSKPSQKAKKKRPNAALTPRRGTPKARKAVFAYEETPKATPPSRKSTRRSKHRQKAATALTGKRQLATTSPHSRHDSGPRVSR
jgi:hypothetical protein